jgi:hypothetical protein
MRHEVAGDNGLRLVRFILRKFVSLVFLACQPAPPKSPFTKQTERAFNRPHDVLSAIIGGLCLLRLSDLASDLVECGERCQAAEHYTLFDICGFPRPHFPSCTVQKDSGAVSSAHFLASVIAVVSRSPIVCSVAVSSAFDSTPVWQREYIRIQRVTRFRRV